MIPYRKSPQGGLVLYSDVFCKVYNEFGWNYYPEIFGEQLLQWIKNRDLKIETAMDLGCGTGILCEILHKNGIRHLHARTNKSHTKQAE